MLRGSARPRASVLHAASLQIALKRLKLLENSPKIDCHAAGILHRIDLPSQIAGKAFEDGVIRSSCSTEYKCSPRADGATEKLRHAVAA